jgi:transcription elongation factor SPT6
VFYERATINVHPTKKGLKEIGEDHDVYTMKYLKDKPVRSLEYDQFLRLKVCLINKEKISNAATVGTGQVILVFSAELFSRLQKSASAETISRAIV